MIGIIPCLVLGTDMIRLKIVRYRTNAQLIPNGNHVKGNMIGTDQGVATKLGFSKAIC
ncbi:MAG: hypothetical protein Phog2KO_03720 [Phototrophicaceae bacterium]